MKDPDWIKKVLIGGLLLLIPIVGAIIVYGYAIEIIKRAYNGTDDTLPEWSDIGGYLTNGVILFVGTLIWMLPFYVVILCTQLVGMSSDAAGLLASCLLYPIGIIYAAAFVPIVAGRFAIMGQFSNMFEINEIWAGVQRAGVNLVLLFVLSLIVGLIASIGLIACCIGVVFTSAYAYMAYANGIGQVYEKAAGTPGITEQQTTF